MDPFQYFCLVCGGDYLLVICLCHDHSCFLDDSSVFCYAPLSIVTPFPCSFLVVLISLVVYVNQKLQLLSSSHFEVTLTL